LEGNIRVQDGQIQEGYKLEGNIRVQEGQRQEGYKLEGNIRVQEGDGKMRGQERKKI